MENKVKVRYVNSGLASTIKDSKGNEYIEINSELNKFPELRKYIMQHELNHLRSNFRNDIKYDLKASFSFKLIKQFIFFYLQHPSAIRQLLPFDLRKVKTKKEEYLEVRVNWFMLMFWVLLFGLIVCGCMIYF